MCDVDCRMLNLEVEQWHDAGTLLATAVQRFCDLSVSLEMQCSAANWKLPDLVTHIDSLQSILDGQLVRARMALINIRNKLSGRSILHLPDEILSDIFIQYVYAPSEEYTMNPMSRRIEDIYQRVHTLLGVCAGLASPAMIFGLCLQRASHVHQNLHLVVSAHHFFLKRLDILAGHWHRFSAVNIWLDSLQGDSVEDYLLTITRNSPPGSISKLSLGRGLGGLTSQHGFSDLGGQISRSLSSASELRLLKLISIVSYYSRQRSTSSLDVISLPKLELLHLERLCFNVLEFILACIARGSYHLTLNLSGEAARENSLPGDEDGGVVDLDGLNMLLKSAPVDKLILTDEGHAYWAYSTGLQNILQSVPGLKTLVLNNFIVDPDVLEGLKPPQNSARPISRDTFPQLTRLEIHGASLAALVDLKPGFEAVFENHQIQTMVFGGLLGLSPWVEDGEPLDENDEVLEWMRHKVPRFHLSP